jgi:hypothetical protein
MVWLAGMSTTQTAGLPLAGVVQSELSAGVAPPTRAQFVGNGAKAFETEEARADKYAQYGLVLGVMAGIMLVAGVIAGGFQEEGGPLKVLFGMSPFLLPAGLLFAIGSRIFRSNERARQEWNRAVDTKHAQALQKWKLEWFCMRCGSRFEPATASVA